MTVLVLGPSGGGSIRELVLRVSLIILKPPPPVYIGHTLTLTFELLVRLSVGRSSVAFFWVSNFCHESCHVRRLAADGKTVAKAVLLLLFTLVSAGSRHRRPIRRQDRVRWQAHSRDDLREWPQLLSKGTTHFKIDAHLISRANPEVYGPPCVRQLLQSHASR